MKMFRVTVVLVVLSVLMSGCTDSKQVGNGSTAKMAVAPTLTKAKPPAGAEPPPPAPAPAPQLPKASLQPMSYLAVEPSISPAAAEGAHVPVVVKKVQATHEPDTRNQYAVKVSATTPLTLDMNKSIKSAGQLIVWVGQPGYEPATQPGKSSVSHILETMSKAESAKIVPFISDPAAFDVDPKESKCQAVEPTGSEVIFSITPNKAGDFKVGASVELYRSSDCTGTAITKTGGPLTVQVKVAISPKPFLQGIFDAFMKFFYEILGVCVAALVFLFRKKIFPFMDKSSTGSGQPER